MVAGVYWALPYSALLLLEGASAIESKTHGRPRLQALVEDVRARLVD